MNTLVVVKRRLPPIEDEKQTGIIPAITEGHMQAPALYASTDYDVFIQDKKERGRVLTAKYKHKAILQKFYGSDWKKHLNIPAHSTQTIHATF